MLCDPKLILKQNILYEKKIHPLRLVVLNDVRAHTYTHKNFKILILLLILLKINLVK